MIFFGLLRIFVYSKKKMSAIYYSNNLEAANNFFVASSRVTASSTQVKNPREITGLILLPFVLVLILLWFLLYIFIITPLSVIIYSVINLMMFYIAYRTKKKLHTYSFETTQALYKDVSELKAVISDQIKEIQLLGWFPLRKPIFWGISSIFNKVLQLEKLFESVLFVDAPSLTSDESAIYSQFLNETADIWQNDNSENEYAKDTHEVLKNRYVRK